MGLRMRGTGRRSHNETNKGVGNENNACLRGFMGLPDQIPFNFKKVLTAPNHWGTGNAKVLRFVLLVLQARSAMCCFLFFDYSAN